LLTNALVLKIIDPEKDSWYAPMLASNGWEEFLCRREIPSSMNPGS